MTIDVPVDSPQGQVLNYSIISSDEEENPLVLKLKISDKHKIPVVVLKKPSDTDQYVVSPRTSNRPRKIKTFDDFETDLSLANLNRREEGNLSPKKRGRSNKTDPEDIEMDTPKKKSRQPRTPGRNHTTNDDDVLDNICTSMMDKVKLSTPVKRLLVDSDVSDKEISFKSPRKKGASQRTPVKETPKKGRGKDGESPMKDENELGSSRKRPVRTPSRFLDNGSSLKSVKVNLDESFRRSVLKCRLNLENGRRDSVIRRRSTRQSFAQFFYDTEDEEVEIEKAVRKSERTQPTKRGIRTRSISTSSSKSEKVFSSDEGEEPLKFEKTKKSTTTTPRKSVKSAPKTPRNRSRLIRSRSDSTDKSISEKDLSSEDDDKRVYTPRKSKKNKKQASATPRSSVKPAQNVKATPKTPKNRLKLLREGVITPSMHSRTSCIPGDSTPLMKARSQLHVSYVPPSLPCREKEYLDVYNFLRGKLDDGCGGCMYISGVPGTGKTATVTSVIDNLQIEREVPKFNYVNVNGMRLTEPRQSYVEIWKQLTGKTVPWEQAQSLLEERFTKNKNKKIVPVVMLIDELDILCTKRQDVVYNLLDWPTKSTDQLIVITIANTMDLPERLLMSRVTSRLGLTRLTFQAYTHKQLMEIVTKRLTGTNSFNPDAIQLVARKVASVSGDARRALDICRRAAEIAEHEGKAQLVNITHINEALTAMITQPQVTAIRRCSRLQRLIMQAIVAEIERTGVEETTFSDVFKMLVSCCALDGFKMVSSTTAQRAVCELSASRLVISDQKCSNIYQRIILNVSVHDVYFALKR